MIRLLRLCLLSIGISAFPQAENGCGVDERGILRQPGDSWRDDCNRCRCLTAGIPGCTKKLCGVFPSLSEPESKACQDSLGNRRQEGETWEDKADICSCGKGVVVCTALITITDVKEDKSTSQNTGDFRGAADGCGLDERGILRQPGDSWRDDCNRCRCLPAGIPGCTKKLCGVFPSLSEPESKACQDSLGNRRQEGETWEDKADICSCGKGVVVCTALVTITDVKEDKSTSQNTGNFRGAADGCGVNERGILRQPGDSWQDDCNRCRCLPAGIPGCTKKLCGAFPSLSEPESKACQDSLGNRRKEGETWEDKADICSCGKGVVVCTTLTVVTDVKKDKSTGQKTGEVNFPGVGVEEADPAQCSDQEGRDRAGGETWAEDCNTCGCYSGVVACTEVFCVDIQLDTSTGVSLFSVDPAREVGETAQCRQEGVTNCRAVSINLEYLQDNITPGDSINFIPGVELSMKLRRAPSGSPASTLSYSFSLSDGGEATVSVRPNTGSKTGAAVFASVKPLTGRVMFSVESCGQGCNVLYERDSGFFNQFQD